MFGNVWEGRLEGKFIESKLKRLGFSVKVWISRKRYFSLGLRSLIFDINLYMFSS